MKQWPNFQTYTERLISYFLLSKSIINIFPLWSEAANNSPVSSNVACTNRTRCTSPLGVGTVWCTCRIKLKTKQEQEIHINHELVCYDDSVAYQNSLPGFMLKFTYNSRMHHSYDFQWYIFHRFQNVIAWHYMHWNNKTFYW